MVITSPNQQLFTFWCSKTDVNNGDFMCLPQVPIQSLGSLMTLNPEFTTVFLTTTGVIVLSFHFKQRRIDHGSSITKIDF